MPASLAMSAKLRSSIGLVSIWRPTARRICSRVSSRCWSRRFGPCRGDFMTAALSRVQPACQLLRLGRQRGRENGGADGRGLQARLGPLEDLQAAVRMFDERGAALHPVAVVDVGDAVDIAHLGLVDVAA